MNDMIVTEEDLKQISLIDIFDEPIIDLATGIKLPLKETLFIFYMYYSDDNTLRRSGFWKLYTNKNSYQGYDKIDLETVLLGVSLEAQEKILFNLDLLF